MVVAWPAAWQNNQQIAISNKLKCCFFFQEKHQGSRNTDDGSPSAKRAKTENKEKHEIGTDAIKIFSKEFFGVGPATASAIIACAYPDYCAFFSDPAALSCGLWKDNKELKYTPKQYASFNKAMQDKAAQLSGKTPVTGNMVQTALWALVKLQ